MSQSHWHLTLGLALCLAMLAFLAWVALGTLRPCMPATWMGATAVVCHARGDIQAGTYVLVEPGGQPKTPERTE